jgi:Rps23 Pro-64 3,4-dihydroxylase Tpa1-like proline 4-hydroxylase
MKNKINFNFKLLKSFDIKELNNKVKNFLSEWDIEVSRQSIVYEGRPNPHVNTNTYIIQDSSLHWERGTLFSKELKDEETFYLFSHIVKELEEIMFGQSARILLIKLNAKSEVFAHKDSGDYLSRVRRFHIPIITNEEVYYTVGEEEIHMKQGDCYEINNLNLHSVKNNSDLDRVHLLIDIMPNCEIKTIKLAPKNIKIKIIENFIDEKDSDFIVDYIKLNNKDETRFYRPQKAIENNIIRYESAMPEIHKPSVHPEILHLLEKYSTKFLLECNNFFKDDEKIYLAEQWLTMLGPGTRLSEHVDNHIESEHLFRSGVIYLNEDFDGGYLNFVNKNITIDPKKCSLVIFDSTELHEITKVLSGIRIAMPIWATNIKEKDIKNG